MFSHKSEVRGTRAGLKPKEPCWYWVKSGSCNKLGCRRLHPPLAEAFIIQEWGRMHADASDGVTDRCRHARAKKYEAADEADTVSQSVLEMHL